MIHDQKNEQFHATNPRNRNKMIPSTCDTITHGFDIFSDFEKMTSLPASLFTRCSKKLRDNLLKESRIPVEIEDIEVLLEAFVVDPEDAIVEVGRILRVVVEMCLEFWGPVPAHLKVETMKKAHFSIIQYIVLILYQCCGSVTFWYGSGSADPCL